MNRTLRLVIIAGTTIPLATAAAAALATSSVVTTGPPTADLAVTSLKANADTAITGSVITVTQVIRNNGPESAEMDAHPLIIGGVLVGQKCDLGISPDSPYCEYGFVPPGTTLTTKYRVRVTAHAGGFLIVKGGVTSEEAMQDDNPFNQYQATRLSVN